MFLVTADGSSVWGVRMPPTCSRLSTTPLSSDRGLWCVPVPWDLVSLAHGYLASRECPSTLCVDPVAREAHLILWPQTDPRRAVELLDGLRGGPSRRAA
jgi:hypothetical protein